MARRGPRGDLSGDRILQAADDLVTERGDVAAVSLRMLADRLGVTANALYTYYPSLADIVHDLADRRLGRLGIEELLTGQAGQGAGAFCPHCALVELLRRAQTLYASPGTLALLKAGPVLGPHSFRLSESVMTLCEGARLNPRDCHDLIMGWFYGSATLLAEGWTSGTDALRQMAEIRDRFPRIADRPAPDPEAQFTAILDGLGIRHRG